MRPHKASRLGVLVLFASLVSSVMAFVPLAHAQTQIVTASPGYINFGMTTSIAVTAPASGTYTVVVIKPGGATSSLPYTFTSAGQTQTATFGSATTGFQGIVNVVGTYNVFVEQGTTVLGSTSFYATNQLQISFLMVTGGTCDYISGVARGVKMFAHIYVTYASNGAAWTNNTAGWSIKANSPGGPIVAGTWDGGAKAFELGVLPNWNYTSVGTWSPAINASDSIGNVGVYKYTGSPFTITPAQMSTSIQLVDSKTSQTVTSLSSGETVNIRATITYPTNAEPVSGFVAPLDSAVRGGAVTAMVGYGYFNASAKTFGGSAKNPGTLLGTVPMTYSGANGTWTGQYTAATLPALPAGQTFEVVTVSSDKASPPNTGQGVLSVAPSLVATQTATSTSAVTSISTAISTTVSTATQTVVQASGAIPTWAYAVMAVLVLVGFAVGFFVTRPK